MAWIDDSLWKQTLRRFLNLIASQQSARISGCSFSSSRREIRPT
jgi:hypothetical protein